MSVLSVAARLNQWEYDDLVRRLVDDFGFTFDQAKIAAAMKCKPTESVQDKLKLQYSNDEVEEEKSIIVLNKVEPKVRSSGYKFQAENKLEIVRFELQNLFNAYNFGYNISVSDLTEEESKNLLERVKDWDIHPNEIESALIIVLAMDKFINGLLPVQGGKSKTATLVTIFERIRSYFNGEVCEYVYVVPSDKSIESMTRSTYESVYTIFNKLIFEKGNKCVSFFEISENGSSDRDEFGVYTPNIHALTSSKKVREQIRSFIEKAKRHNSRLIVVWDEAHFADNKKSGADSTIGDLIVNLKKDLNNLGLKQKLLCLSATPFPYCDLEFFKELGLKVGRLYFGYNFWKGKLIDPDAGCNTPIHISFSNLQLELGLKVIPLDLHACFNATRFEKLGKAFFKEHGIDLGMNIDEYYEEVCHQISQIILSDKLNGKKGSLLRFLNNNLHTEEILNKVKFLLDDVVYIRYYGEKSWDELNSEIKRCSYDLKKYFIIVVSARARMSNRFPREVETFIDFTTKYYTFTSTIQGLCGRAACYGLQRTVILSDYNYDVITAYVDALGDVSSDETAKVLKRMDLHGRAVRGGMNTAETCPTHSFNVRDDKEVMTHVKDVLMGAVKSQTGKRCQGVWIAYNTLFPEWFIELMICKYGVRPLRKGETPKPCWNTEDVEFKKYHINDKDEIFVSFRTTKKGLYSGRAEDEEVLEGKRTTSILQNPKKKRGIEPHLHINVKTGRIHHFEIALFNHLNRIEGQKTYNPTSKSLFGGNDESIV